MRPTYEDDTHRADYDYWYEGQGRLGRPSTNWAAWQPSGIGPPNSLDDLQPAHGALPPLALWRKGLAPGWRFLENPRTTGTSGG
jgi:hypothetical protein